MPDLYISHGGIRKFINIAALTTLLNLTNLLNSTIALKIYSLRVSNKNSKLFSRQSILMATFPRLKFQGENN